VSFLACAPEADGLVPADGDL